MLNIRVIAFISITKVLIVHHSYYHGYRKKEQPNSSVLRDSRLSRLCKGVQLYPHRNQDKPPYPCSGKGCLTLSNLSLIQPECHMKGLTGFPVNVPDIPDRCHPLASFMDKQVTN
jgi:hypothetical protein